MKNVTIAKQLIIALSIGMACSAHAQLLGRGGAVGGMIGGAGNFGGMASFDRGAMRDSSRPAAGASHGEPVRQARPASGGAASEAGGNGAAGLLGNVTAERQAASDGQAAGSSAGSAGQSAHHAADPATPPQPHGSASGAIHATADADGSGVQPAARSAVAGARGTARPLRDGAQAQADNTRAYARSSAATAVGAANASKQGATEGARAATAQPAVRAGGSVSGSGDASAM